MIRETKHMDIITILYPIEGKTFAEQAMDIIADKMDAYRSTIGENKNTRFRYSLANLPDGTVRLTLSFEEHSWWRNDLVIVIGLAVVFALVGTWIDVNSSWDFDFSSYVLGSVMSFIIGLIKYRKALK